MLTLQNIPQLLQRELTDFLLQTLQTHFPDYRSYRDKKDDAIRHLAQQLPTAPQEEAAAAQQLSSVAFFSAMLGLKANLDNFLDPVRGRFLDADPEIYLREDLARRLPDYCSAEAVRDRFYGGLTPEQRQLYEPVQDYMCYMETVLPKLAHYCGYVLGNALFPKAIPAYGPDTAQTLRYQLFLSDYFGKKLAI